MVKFDSNENDHSTKPKASDQYLRTHIYVLEMGGCHKYNYKRPESLLKCREFYNEELKVLIHLYHPHVI